MSLRRMRDAHYITRKKENNASQQCVTTTIYLCVIKTNHFVTRQNEHLLTYTAIGLAKYSQLIAK